MKQTLAALAAIATVIAYTYPQWYVRYPMIIFASIFFMNMTVLLLNEALIVLDKIYNRKRKDESK